MSDTNPFDAAAAGVMQAQTVAIRNNVYNAVPQNPAQVAQHAQIAQNLGIPLESVQSDPTVAKQQAAMQSFDAQKVVTQYPHLAQFLTDPTNAAKSHDDLTTLAATEQAVKSLPKPVPASAAPAFGGQQLVALPDQAPSIRDRLTDAWASVIGGPTAEQQRQASSAAEANAILAGRQINPALIPPPGSTPAQTAALNDQAWNVSRNAVGGISRAPQMAAEGAAKAISLGLVSPIVPATSHSWQDSISGGLGQLAGFIAGPAKMAEAALGAVPKFGAALTAGAGDAWATALLKEAAAQAVTLGLASGAQEAGSAALDSHTAWEAASRVGAAAKSGAITGALFGIVGRLMPDNTLAQWAGRFAAVSAAQDATSGQTPWDERPIQQKVFDYGQNAYFTMNGAGRTPGAWFANSPIVIDGVKNTDTAVRATQGMQGLQALGELSQASALRKNDPQAFHDFVQKVTEDGHLPEVWIEGKTLVDALAQSGVSPDALKAKMPDVAAQLHEAMETGGDVRISTADYATNIAGGPLEQSILPHLKTDPDGMTYSQGQDHLAQQQTDMTAQAQDLVTKQGKIDERTQQLKTITDGVQQQLEATGRYPSDVAKQYAALHGAFYDNMSERMGISPEEMRQRMPLTIRGEGADGFNQGTGEGPFGPVTDQFKGDAAGAIAHLTAQQGGEAVGALTHPDIGDIDLVWGKEGTGKSDGYGLAKLLKYHPEVVDNLQNILSSMTVKSRSENRINLESTDHKAAVRLQWNGEAKKWLMTAFEKKGDASTRTDTAGLKGEDDTARSTVADISIDQDLKNFYQSAKTDERTGLPLNADGTVTVYHHTSADKADEIRQSGVLKSAGEPDLYFTTTRQTDTGYGDTAIPFRVKPDRLSLDDEFPDGRQDYRVETQNVGNSRRVKFLPDGDALLYQGERGSYDPATGQMSLLKDADLSTFLHESGHFFLESIHDLTQHPEAPQGIKNDFDTLLSSFKVDGATPEERAANWAGRTLDEKRAGHEQFAEGFEHYLMTGKAPVPELQSMFSRFRSWLMNVYSSMRGEVSPEVRGVMDRMFASQEAITEAERVRAYAIPDLSAEHGPLIDDYKTLGKEATEQAIADMQSRSLRDLKWASNAKSKALRELQRTAKDERAKITDEVTKEVMAEPVNKARTWLTKGEMTDGDGNPVKVEKGFKLNTDDLKSLFPQGALGSIDLADLRGMTAKEGLHPDLVADMFGFNSGKGLVNELIHGETAAAKIKGVTDQRMLERHGDLIDPVSVERAAEAAIHNEVRAKMMATGLKMFTKSPMSVIEINKAAKAAADTAIAQKTVGDLRPAQYSAAEAKANKELLKLAPKDPMGAAQAQRAALLNNRLFKSANEAVADVRAGLVYLKRFTRDSVRGKIDVDVRDQIDALLARFDLRANPSDAPTRGQLNLEKWIDSQAAAGYSPTVTPEMLAPEFRKPYRDLSVEQFRGMVDTIKSMEHMGKERNMLSINGEKQNLSDFVNNELVPKLQERGDRFTTDEIYSRVEDRGVSPMAVALDHVSSWLRALGAQLKPQEFKRNDFDRHELLGPFGKALFDPVIDANYNKVRMLKGLSDDFRVKADELGADWQKSLHDMLPNDKLIDAIATKETGQPVYFKMSRGKMVGMAIHVGNESNFDKLTKGYGWEPEKVWSFLHDNMTAKDWNAVQHVWDLYEKHWPDAQAMYKRLGQTTPDKIEPRAFHTPFGEMAGGYAAIKYDPLRSRRGEKDAAGAAIDPGKGLFGADYFSRTATTNGSMNKRMDGYTDAIDLNFHTIERSMQESIHDLAYREALINANKIVEHPDFRKAFFTAYGREQYSAVQDWIGRIANSANSDREVGAMGRFLQYTRTGMVMNAIALRATTVLKHGGSAGIKTLGYFAGGGEKYLANRMASMGSDYTNQIASAKEKFGEINARLLQQDRDYRATASSMFEPESIKSQAERFGHAAVAWSDMMTAVPTAWAAYDRAIAEGIPVRQGGTGQPMTEAQAVSYANKIVREAHGSNVEAARSNIMTAPSEGLKMFTTLYGFMNNSYGQMADSINKFQTPGIGKPEIVARTFMAIIVPALWAGYLTEGGLKEGEGWGAWAAKAIAGEVAGMVPVVRDAASMLHGYQHAGVIGAESWLSTMVHAGRDLAHLAQGKIVNAPIRDVFDAIGMGLHIPGLGQLGKSAQYVADVHSGKQHPANAGEYVKGMVVGAPKK